MGNGLCQSPGGEGTEGAHSHDVAGRVPVHITEGLWQWALSVQQVVGHHKGESRRHPEVGKETDEQRSHDTDGDGTHRVLGLFTCVDRDGLNMTVVNHRKKNTLVSRDKKKWPTCCCDAVEPHKGIEAGCCPRQDSTEAKWSKTPGAKLLFNYPGQR